MAQQIRSFFLIMLLLASCNINKENQKSSVKIIDEYHQTYPDSILRDRLDIAFQNNSSDSLSQFFTEWNETVQPNTNAYIVQNDTINAVFESYKAFFKPQDLLKLGKWEWGNDLNANSKYVVVQNKILFAVSSSENIDGVNPNDETFQLDSISNFRPPLLMEDDKVLYLTDQYKKLLNHFLELNDLSTPSNPIEKIEKRYGMFRKFIPILHGHWGGYWHLETHPQAYFIYFNKDLTMAKFDFRVGYQGGEALLTKGTNGWTIEKSKITWIE